MIYSPAGIYLLKVNNRNTRTRCEICSRLTIQTPEQCQWCRSLLSLFLSVCLPACLPAWLTGCLAGCLADWMAGCLGGCLADWLAGWLTGWLAGRLTDWLTDWLHGLTCVVSRVRVLHSFIVTSTSTLGIEWATPCNPILLQQCFQAFKLQIISDTFQPRVPTTAPRVTPSYNCLVYLFWPCDWIRILNMAITTKTPASQYIFYATQTQSTS